MNLSVERSVEERVKTAAIAFVVSFALAAAYLYFRARMGESAPALAGALALGVALVSTWLVDAAIGRSIEGLRIARLGSTDVRRAHLDTSSSNRVAVNAFVAVEAGDIERAARIVDTFPKTKSLTSTEQLAKLRVQLASVSGDKRKPLVEKLMEWESGLGGMQGRELERYRAFVLADLMVRDDGVKSDSIAQKLLAHDDEQVRAYATWLASDVASDARADGAALARHHGHSALAERLLVRAPRS